MGKRKDKGKRRPPPEKKDMNTTKLQITMDEVRKLRDEDPGKAFDAIKNSGIDLTTAPELWEMHIILLEKLKKFDDSFLAASKYAKDYNVEVTVNAELVKILGDGELRNCNYSRAYCWYEVGSVTEDASLLAYFRTRGLAARKICALKGSKSDINDMIKVLCSYSQLEEVMELIDTAKVVPKESSLSMNFKVYALAKLGFQDEAFEIARSYIGDNTPEQVAADNAVFTNTASILATGFSNAGKHKDAVQWYKTAKKMAIKSGDVEQVNYCNALVHFAVTMEKVQQLRDKYPDKALYLIEDSGIDLTTAPELWEIKIILLEKLERFRDSFDAASKYAYHNIVKCSNVVELVRILCNGGINFKRNYAKAYEWYKTGVSMTKDKSLLDSFNQMGLLARTRCAEKGSEDDITAMIKVLCHFCERENVEELIETAKRAPKGSPLSEKFKNMVSTMLDGISGDISEGLIENKEVKSSSEKFVDDFLHNHNSSDSSPESKAGEMGAELAVVPGSLSVDSVSIRFVFEKSKGYYVFANGHVSLVHKIKSVATFYFSEGLVFQQFQ